MPDKTNLPDQGDILVTNERLTAELTAATDLLDAAQAQATEATQRAEGLGARLATVELAARVAGEELTRLKAENTALTARMADFNTAVAAEVQKLGLRPKAADHKQPPADADLTPTQRVLAAKGVGSLAELGQQPKS